MTVSNSKIAILGATSYLAQKVCLELGNDKSNSFVLVARDEERLGKVQADLVSRDIVSSCIVFDFDEMTSHESFVEEIKSCDSFWFFYGSLPDQQSCENNWELAEASFKTNCVSVMSLLTRLSTTCVSRGSGSFVIVSSVAGERGRQSNYHYGTAKGAVTLFCEGLRSRLYDEGISLLVAKPGFFVSPMTEAVDKKPAVLWVDAERIAKDIVRAWLDGKDVVYTPWFWRPIMRIIREMPTAIFKRLSL